MNLIVAVDNKNGIGKNNDLLISIPDDMKYFRDKTLNKVVVMGRKTLESFPDKKPLKNRTNIVLSSNSIDNIISFNNIDDLLLFLKKYDSNDIFVIGGASIYKQLLPFCDTAYITEIDKDFNADVFFPELDSSWKLVESSDVKNYNGISYVFKIYKNTEI